MDSSTPPRASPAPPSKADGMASTSRTSRGSTPTASRPVSRLVKETGADRPARAASSNSLKQKTANKGDEPPRPSRADEVRSHAHTYTYTHAHAHTNAPLRDMAADAAQQLKALKTDFDGLRSHLTCKICDRMLYQPYTIACGHTYCYTVRRRGRIIFAPGTQQADHTQCLCTWFLNLKQNKSKLTCPDCRLDVKHLPAPAYVVRQAHPIPHTTTST
jgi:hypothetical protein